MEGYALAVSESYEETGGRDGREIVLKGMIEDKATVTAIEAALDSLMMAASEGGYVALSLRADRQLQVRRTGFKREVQEDRLLGAFTLHLESKTPFEEAVTETSTVWNISASGATQGLSPSGNATSALKIEAVASGLLINPCFSDGTRLLCFGGQVADGETLILDGVNQRVTLEGEDVTPYTSGLFPQAAPEGVTLCYTDDAASSHSLAATLRYRDQWW